MFIPLGWSRLQQGELYTTSDPEWQEFVKLSKDRKKLALLQTRPAKRYEQRSLIFGFFPGYFAAFQGGLACPQVVHIKMSSVRHRIPPLEHLRADTI
jgi:hypothetical protein